MTAALRGAAASLVLLASLGAKDSKLPGCR